MKIIIAMCAICAISLVCKSVNFPCNSSILMEVTWSGQVEPTAVLLSKGTTVVSYTVSGRATQNGADSMEVTCYWGDPADPEINGSKTQTLTPSGNFTKQVVNTYTINVPDPSPTWTYSAGPWMRFESDEWCANKNWPYKSWARTYYNYDWSSHVNP